MVAIPGFWPLPNLPNNTGTYYFTAEERQMAQYRQSVSSGMVLENEEVDYIGGLMQAV
jgi:hypothetical protein